MRCYICLWENRALDRADSVDAADHADTIINGTAVCHRHLLRVANIDTLALDPENMNMGDI